MLEAADWLRQVQGRQETAAHRLQEIKEKQQRLQQTIAANAQLLQQLEARRRELDPVVRDARTMMPTVQDFDESSRLLVETTNGIRRRPSDPFLAAQQLDTIKQRWEAVADQARCDREVFSEAERSLQAAAVQLETARRLASTAATDNLADSGAIVSATEQADSLAAALARVQPAVSHAHSDWKTLDAEVDRIASEAARCAAVLRNELQTAETAVAALSASATAVRLAGGWTGGWGVALMGCPGANPAQPGAHRPATRRIRGGAPPGRNLATHRRSRRGGSRG